MIDFEVLPRGFNEVATANNKPAVAIDTIEVKFDASSNVQSKSLYGNSVMQVRVLVLVTGKDEDDNPAPLPNSVLGSVMPIYYNGGQPLTGNWFSTWEENEYLHELPSTFSQRGTELSASEAKARSIPHVVEFWISSKVVGSAQIAAQVTINGKTVKSNNTGSDLHDSSVTLNAILPPVYPIEYFKQQRLKVENTPGLSDIFKIYLSLSLPSGGVNLRKFSWAGYPMTEVLRDVYAPNYWTFFLGLVHPDVTSCPVPLMNGGGVFNVRVNDRVGELNLVESLNYKTGVGPKKLDIFYFSAIDDYGTSHKLRIRPTFRNGQIYERILERG
ncbi:TPA: hypothetical protein SAN82_002734 [Pseudomonas putida]|nr:hypothetical protein [Pseudomonas putida]